MTPVELGGLVSGDMPAGFARKFLEEGLIIVGWAANWKPIEVFLFEWWPISPKSHLYRRLADAQVGMAEDPQTSVTGP